MLSRRNPKGAGRKPLDTVGTNIKISVPTALFEDWEKVENKTGFAREAIAAKLKAKAPIGECKPNQKILITQITISHHGKTYWGQTETGEVFEGAAVYPDANGELCLMPCLPVSGDVDEAADWISEKGYPITVWASDEVSAHLPKNVQWYVEKT